MTPQEITEKELHQMAMKEVGDHLEAEGFEFLSISSDLKKDPQFVCLKQKKLHFVVVKGCVYPKNPKTYDPELMDKITSHAQKYNAKVWYAGVGFARAENYELPLSKSEAVAINFTGLNEIL